MILQDISTNEGYIEASLLYLHQYAYLSRKI